MLSSKTSRHFVEHLPRILTSFFSTNTSTAIDVPSFLQSSCGLSPPSALAIADYLRRSKPSSSPDPRSIVHLLKRHNFTAPDLASLLTRQPRILALDPLSDLEPKLRFFADLGLSPKSIAAYPLILRANLHNRLLPNVQLLRSVLPSDDDLTLTLRRAPGFLTRDLEKLLPPIIQSLRERNVSWPVISTFLVKLASRLMRVNCKKFDGAFRAIEQMSISPCSIMFAHALIVLAQMPESEWDRKVEVYRQLGWSKEQVLTAFARHPYCMSLSDEKTVRNARFFDEKLGWGPASLLVYPVLLSLSLEKRIAPRYEVWQILSSKGLVKGNLSARYFLIPQKDFADKYVTKYKSEAPELSSISKNMKDGVKVSSRKMK